MYTAEKLGQTHALSDNIISVLSYRTLDSLQYSTSVMLAYYSKSALCFISLSIYTMHFGSRSIVLLIYTVDSVASSRARALYLFSRLENKGYIYILASRAHFVFSERIPRPLALLSLGAGKVSLSLSFSLLYIRSCSGYRYIRSYRAEGKTGIAVGKTDIYTYWQYFRIYI